MVSSVPILVRPSSRNLPLVSASKSSGPTPMPTFCRQSPAGDWRQKVGMGVGPLLLLALTKGKFLLLGLTKIGTLLTMLASLGVYWAIYGWAFALGLDRKSTRLNSSHL